MAKKTASKAPRQAKKTDLVLDPAVALEQGNSPHGAEVDPALPTDRDSRREATREQGSRSKFPVGEKAEKAREKLDQPSKAGRRASGARKAEPKTVDDLVPSAQPAGVTSVMDHGAMLHPREEHLHRPNEANARVEGPTPRDPRLVDDVEQLMEQLRLETKADNLYLMRRRERQAEEPREHVIDSINARLREVQGEPILDE